MSNAAIIMKKEPFPYIPFDQYVLRTPLLPFTFYRKLTSADQISNKSLKKAFTDVVIKEAIFLASPTLFFELEKWLKGELEQKKERGVILSLLKYLSRMCSRCTPFGLFAGCTMGNFAENTEITMGNTSKHKRFTRPDMNYLVALSQDLAKKEHIKQQLIYTPNSSLYSIGEQLRYIEYFYVDSRRQHHIVEIDSSPYLLKILKTAENGASLQELVTQLVDGTISEEEALGFVDELLESQVLISNLEPSVSGPPFVDQMLTVLNTLRGCDTEVEFLNRISIHFKKLDHGMGNNPQEYLKLSTFLKQQQTGFELKYLFQTDLEPQTILNSLEQKHISQIKKALVLFNKITPLGTENNLTRFRDAFYERYEEREMPLSYVMDVETGIGYLQNSGSGDTNPLIDDLVLPPFENTMEAQDLKMNKVHRILLEKILEAKKNKARVVRLKTDDFDGLPQNWEDLSDTFSTMVDFVRENGEIKIRISGCGGPSAANLLGRFCHQGSTLTPFTKNIIAKEKVMEPDKILAEIVHLPEARVGNILMRPNFREFEIPYLAKTIVQEKRQLPIQDLFISVRDNRIHLRSKKHNKEVLPKLANAHNFSANSLPIYHFLADMQSQGLRGWIGLSFGPLDAMFDFLPRVEYDNLILHEAKWRIRSSDFKGLLVQKGQKEELMKNVFGLREDKDIPQFVLLADGDNELLVNLENYTSVLMLLETIKNREEFILKEFLHHQDGVVSSEKGYHTNQVVISFFNKNKMDRVSQSVGERYDTA